jgi:hypothetical protein
LLAGDGAGASMTDGLARVLGRPWRWIQPLVTRFAVTFRGHPRPRLRAVAEFIAQDRSFARAWLRYARRLRSGAWMTEPQRMRPVQAAAAWELPRLESVAELADWLCLEVGRLEWFADLKGWAGDRREGRLRHYSYRVLTKNFGSVRLIEAPKPRLKALQRLILRDVLDRIPAHPAVHGFVPGRSILTFVTPHVGRQVVLRMDLADFFPSIGAARVQALFRTAGYPETVADLLGGLCTTATPADVWREAGIDVDRERLQQARSMYRERHLPQGAPTSPALANLCGYRMDCRLAALARAAGAAYTRYADDLAFSGDTEFARAIERFAVQAAAIAQEEGFRVHHRKTRVMRQGVRQHLAGLVTNERANVPRDEYDRLKATLTNCVRLGPEGQNREGHPAFREHLLGRIGFVEGVNPARGRRLREMFARIEW